MNRVKDFRKKLDLSQLDLAKKIGVSRQTINMIENNKYNPTLELCISLALALKTDLNTLFWNKEKIERLNSNESSTIQKNYLTSSNYSPYHFLLLFLHLDRSYIVLDRCGSDCLLHLSRSKIFEEGLDFLRLPSRFLSCFMVK